MSEPSVLLVSITVDDETHALRMAERLVMEHLAASANVQAAHTSFRLEHGQLVEYQETSIRATTTTARFDALCERVSTMPGIVMPGISATPLTMSHPRFEPWIHAVLEACKARAA
ncbi:divalent cation tolerance protein CutA [Roseomonas sp. NAR14]|uniref:Divalent cation tolerance protein CutA n=1 Tax=Roseomonas acroporae TaxID=2937791 RepID=A0A9X1YDU2_9PROT|nr:divalent cation tolerance protein CutA [Roseomonas acroporae]MCK8784651.1 divalent cation tolerance protein CutA [Roseomonas acroporae]